MIECANEWWISIIEWRPLVQCPMSNVQRPMPKWGTWKLDIECSALIIASRRDVLRLCVTFVHTFCESCIRACLSADRHSWPTIRWVKTAPKKMINWMINIEHRLLNTKGPSFWTSAAEARMVKNLPLWITIYSEDSSAKGRTQPVTLHPQPSTFHFPLSTLNHTPIKLNFPFFWVL